MNCEKCQDLLSDFLDGALSREQHALVSAHFEECLDCSTTRDELDSIVNFCRDHRGEYDAPPNERALWLRIRNTIEGDSARATAVAASATIVPRPSWWTRWTNRSWELSFSQMAMAVSAIVIAVSLATAFSLRRMENSQMTSPATATNAPETNARNQMALAASGDNLRVKSISQEIEYWQQRVDERKVRWSAQRRADFESNLRVLNEAVEERLKDLKANPHDDITEQMLDAVLNNKAELLREFSEL